MDAAMDMLWHAECGGQGVDSPCRVSEDGESGDFQSLTNCVDVICNILSALFGRMCMGELTWPAQRSAGTIRIRLTVSNSWTVRGNQAQLERESQLVIEGSDISCKAHTNTAKNRKALCISYLGEGYRASCLRVSDFL